LTPEQVPTIALPAPTETGPRCPECDYPLTTLTEPRCPWCGWTLDANVLAAVGADRGRGSTWGVFLASLLCAAGSSVSVASLLRGSAKLAVWDGLAVIAVAIAVAGHLALAAVLLAVQLHRLLPRHVRSPLLRFAAVFSIGLGLIAAGRMLQPRPVLGVPVEAVLEFALVAALFTLPGWTLLVLHTIARNTLVPSLLISRPRPNRVDAASGRAPFVVDIGRCFAPTQISATMGVTRRESTAAIDAAFERVWQTEVAIAAEERRVLYDGKLIRLHRWTVDGDRLTLELGETSYREFFGTNVHDEGGVKAIGPDSLANPLGISALLLTRDGYLCLGRRGSAVALHAGTLHTFGGMIEEVDRSAYDRVDVSAALARELHEELALSRQEWIDATAAGLVRDRGLQQPELIFDVSISLSRAELLARFASRGPDAEHTAVEFAHDDPESLLAWLDSAGPVAPIAEAALLLHGRHTWGDPWYEHACYSRYAAIPSA